MTPALAGLAELLRYPDQGYASRIEETLSSTEDPTARELLRTFQSNVSGLSTGELQELYTRTFDLSPLCSLEAGWQLYGEDYARGSLLAYMKARLQELHIPERGELPDHLANLLPALARMNDDEAAALREGAALPAVRKMLQAFAGKTNPYGDLLRAVARTLEIPAGAHREELSHV